MPLVRWIGRAMMSPARRMRRSRFDAVPAPEGRVVFFGDSITEQGLWDEWFPELKIANRGVGGETVAEVTARVDTAIKGARAVSLLVGTNDITGFGASRKAADIADQYEVLLARIRDVVADAPVLLTSVLPRDRFFADRVRALNGRIEAMADAWGMTYVDAWSRMHGRRGELRPELTHDRIHLTGTGYREWLTVLRPALERALAETTPQEGRR
ncbi:GDSL-type esterase/lipase family protein [Microbacterium sp. ZW T5_45]|uniref:GDSL-type esterase/lipase family protein n=1 Tax=Microbacterium sp. ZW T5_45 TaxID=3378080 RepID=UPI003853170C